jgi:heme-degrading monooxygenase HmoA
MIRHTVIFKLKYPLGSAEESGFLEAASALSLIQGAHQFESLRQISKKNDFEYGLSMEFDSKADYQAYNQHPEHAKFIEDYWAKSVEKFLEIDYEIPN